MTNVSLISILYYNNYEYLTLPIDEMIEEIRDNLKKWTMSNLEFTDLVAQKYILEKTKSRLSLTQK